MEVFKMKNQKIVNEVYKIVAPLIEKMDNMENTNMIEYQLDEICGGLTKQQNNLLDEMLEENGII